MSILGFDVGGTKISCCVGERDGSVTTRIERPTSEGMDGNEMTRTLISLGSEAMGLAGIEVPEALGIIFAGFIDQRKGMVMSSPNIPGIQNFPVVNIMSDFFQSKVYLENDATAAAIAERIFGSGKGKSDFVYVTLSTGIGAGVFSNGKLLKGSRGLAGEVGHMVVSESGHQCGCGRRGCLEAMASGSGIVKRTLYRLPGFTGETVLRSIPEKQISAKSIIEAAYSGDRFSKEILDETIKYLGIGLANVASIYDPQLIIIGGGITQSGDRFFNAVKKSFRDEAKGVQRNMEITRALPDISDLAAISLPLYYGRNRKS
ncbi:MAG: ROK family protein [Thermoplasmataceae archaeon]